MKWLSDAREFTVPFGNKELRAWAWGDGGSRTALLVHGWAGRGSQLGSLAAPLVAQGFRVVAFDGPGHGRSSGRRSSLPEMAGAVAAMLRNLRGADAVIAHSLGATATAAALAGYPGLDSDLDVGALAFVAPPSEVHGLIRRFSQMTGLSMPVLQEMRRRIEKRFGIEWHELQVSQLAPRIARPVWVAHCVDDREIPIEQGRELAAVWPGASLHETAGLGHRRILRDRSTIRHLVGYVARYGTRSNQSGKASPTGSLHDSGATRKVLGSPGRSATFDAAVAGYDA
ncbi:MAG: alpha/beta fold hydrolase [Thermoanaerobaculia bacterium]|nr:alpha/beta fold hydrolase [Thermoanaerobaculia bacterium]